MNRWVVLCVSWVCSCSVFAGFQAEVMRQGDGVIDLSRSQNGFNLPCDVLEVQPPSWCELRKADYKGDTKDLWSAVESRAFAAQKNGAQSRTTACLPAAPQAHIKVLQKLWRGEVDALPIESCEESVISDSLLTAKKPMQFVGLSTLYSAAMKKPWQERKKLDCSIYKPGDMIRDVEGSFFVRVLREPQAFKHSFPVNTWEEMLDQMALRTPHSGAFSSIASASLCSLERLNLYRYASQPGEPMVGLIINIPTDAIMAASLEDLKSPYSTDFYEDETVGKKYLELLARAGLAPPESLLVAGNEHNEVVYDPTSSKITAVFFEGKDFDPKTAADHVKAAWDFAEKYNLPFIRFSPVESA